MALHFGYQERLFTIDLSTLTSQFFLLVFWGLPAQRRSLLWWTLALICDLRPPLNCQRPRRRGTPPPPSSRNIRSHPVRRGRTVRLHSLVSPSGSSAPDVPPVSALPPSGTRSLRRTDRPRALPVTGNGCPLAWVDSCAVHAARDTYN